MDAFKRYSEYYDLLYKDKNYLGECTLLEEIFEKHNKREIKSILDLGCGTGSHAICLAKRGYQVTGIDASKKMLSIARKKSCGQKSIKFVLADIRNFDLNKKFDAAIAMFSVMGYLTADQSIRESLRCVRKHLEDGSPFIFDVWFGPAVLENKPAKRVKTITNNSERITRVAKSQLDVEKNVVRVTYKITKTVRNKIADEVTETHEIRFFFARELEDFLKENGFKILEMRPPANYDWNIFVVAEAV